jgi:hypothetical protein
MEAGLFSQLILLEFLKNLRKKGFLGLGGIIAGDMVAQSEEKCPAGIWAPAVVFNYGEAGMSCWVVGV